jgi:hypothetical protein
MLFYVGEIVTGWVMWHGSQSFVSLVVGLHWNEHEKINTREVQYGYFRISQVLNFARPLLNCSPTEVITLHFSIVHL